MISRFVNRSALAIAALVISTSAIASAQYKFTKIAIPKAIRTYPFGISNKNEVVGEYQIPKFGALRTYGFWRTNDIPAIWHYPLEDPNGFDQYTIASSIDSGRIVVGTYESNSGGNFAFNGFFLNGGTYFDYNAAGCTNTFINGINDTGETTGYCQGAGSANIGWLNTRTDGLVLFTYPGANQTYANAVNQAREVVGTFIDTMGQTHGYLRISAGNFTQIDFPGATLTNCNGISDNGLISGTFLDAGSHYHGFVFSLGTFTQVDVPNASNTYVMQINKHGHFVGFYDDLTETHTYGFLAKP